MEKVGPWGRVHEGYILSLHLPATMRPAALLPHALPVSVLCLATGSQQWTTDHRLKPLQLSQNESFLLQVVFVGYFVTGTKS